MVNLTRIYTRTGDDGTTSLGDLSRTTKNDPRLIAYADVDEANSALGVAIALGDLPEPVAQLLTQVQNDLFDVGADLCTPVVENPQYPPLRVLDSYVDRLEAACDEYNDQLEKLRSFVLPGGTSGAALLHVARTVTRRAERATSTGSRTCCSSCRAPPTPRRQAASVTSSGPPEPTANPHFRHTGPFMPLDRTCAALMGRQEGQAQARDRSSERLRRPSSVGHGSRHAALPASPRPESPRRHPSRAVHPAASKV